MISPRAACAAAALALSASFLAPAAALSPAGPDRAGADLLGEASLMSAVREYAGLGDHHRTGTAAERRTQAWLTRGLRSAGLRVGSDAYTFAGFLPRTVALSVGGAPVAGPAAYLYSGLTRARGITAELVDVGSGSAAQVSSADVAGRIAVVTVPVVNGLTVGLPGAFRAVDEAGAAGLVVVTDGPDGLVVHQNVDSRAGVQDLPTLLVGSDAGAEVVAAAGERATLTLTARVGQSCDTDVWGVLPGADPDRYLVIGTPTSAHVSSGSERGAGVAVLLGLARHYASLPRSERPVGLVFAGLSGHEIGFLGLPVLLAAHESWFARADAYLHLGASIATRALASTSDLPVGEPTRSLYVSENPVLEAVATASFLGSQPLSTTPPSVLNPGEQSVAYAAGIPIIGISGSGDYFHTAGDTPDVVVPSLLVGQAVSYSAAIDSLATLPAGLVRSANALALQAAQQAEAPEPADTERGGRQPQPVRSCVDRRPTQSPLGVQGRIVGKSRVYRPGA
ncbi:MAG: hypothetical protein F2667_04140 [Actinobacteria bacterium]|uniref:Unannotated protein n=1 Tax=freshwater metagenome TaxID=449393 RepID=A0A6J6PQ95_9ZZZZ|nr:hypothetical protein [Actinomycetota bacterium]